MMTEGNMSGSSSGIFPDIMGALWLADFEGSFLTAGGAASYYYHSVPEPMWRGCDAGGGAFSYIQVDRDYKVKGLLSQYFAAQLITREWVQPIDQPHRLFRVTNSLRDQIGRRPLTTYAVLRPDDQWSLLVVNRDHERAYSVSISFRDGVQSRERQFKGPVTQFTFGDAQYQWHNQEENSYADPDGPPAKSEFAADGQTRFEIPKASIVVLRGQVN
jgi:hypothetical protein